MPMANISFLALLSLSLVIYGTQATVSHRVTRVSLPRLESEFTATTIPEAQFNVPIVGSVKKREAKKASLAKLLARGHPRGGQGSSTAPIAGADLDEEYVVNVTVGPHTYALIIDTGSSDTWVAEKGFTCTNLAFQQQPESECLFGPLYDPSQSKSFRAIPNENFNITYGM
jgi:hypothetical protein